MYRRIRGEKGITLIALVITIIVLIILAAATLGVLAGENGIIRRALKAREDTKYSVAEELIKLAYTEAIVEQHAGNNISVIDNIIARLAEEGYTLTPVDLNGVQVQQEVTGIVVKDGSNAVSSVNVEAKENETKTLTVELVKATPEGDTEYRIEIDGKYYKVYIESGNIRIDRNNVRDSLTQTTPVAQSYTVTITVANSITSYVTANESVTLTTGGTESTSITITPPAQVTDNITGNISIATTGQTGDNWNKAVAVTISKPLVVGRGCFVEYNVAYDDTYINKSYSTTNGWRLLDYTDNGNGTYSNVKLISTGIPARLNYNSGNTTNTSWWETDETELTNFITTLSTTDPDGGTYNMPSYYISNLDGYKSLQAALGLYKSNKFLSIQYKYGTSISNAWGDAVNNNSNRGYFKSITNGATTFDSTTADTKTGADLFRVSGINADIRLLTLPELNKLREIGDNDSINQIFVEPGVDADGLLRMDRVQNLTGMSEYVYDLTTYYYWLASPYATTVTDWGHYNWINVVSGMGGISSGNNTAIGIRPVICLNSTVRIADTNGNGVFDISN